MLSCSMPWGSAPNLRRSTATCCNKLRLGEDSLSLLRRGHERQPCAPKERVFGANSRQVRWPWTGIQTSFEGNRFRSGFGLYGDESQMLSKP